MSLATSASVFHLLISFFERKVPSHHKQGTPQPFTLIPVSLCIHTGQKISHPTVAVLPITISLNRWDGTGNSLGSPAWVLPQNQPSPTELAHHKRCPAAVLEGNQKESQTAPQVPVRHLTVPASLLIGASRACL